MGLADGIAWELEHGWMKDAVFPKDTIKVDAFRNMFAILHSLTPRELAGITTSNTWPPTCLTTFVLKLDDCRLDKLYALVQAKQPARYRGVV